MVIVAVVIIIVFIYVLVTYNSFVGGKNRIEQATSGIDVYLTQRFELIPNLIECVKGYMNYEKETFAKITEMRSVYMQTRNLKDGERLNNECNKIIAIAENYPELKASEQFLNLQKNLTKMESQLQAARRIYNLEVKAYNNKIQMFPSNLLAKMFQFKEVEFFQAEEQAQKNISINGGW